MVKQHKVQQRSTDTGLGPVVTASLDKMAQNIYTLAAVGNDPFFAQWT